MISRNIGSSPRMWGTPFLNDSGSDNSWFIPTHVGNSDIGELREGDRVVHPHACGELRRSPFNI